MNIKLFRSCFILIIFFLLLTGCSVHMAKTAEKKRNQMVNALKVDTPRSEVVNTFGKPYKKDGKFIDFYEICIPSPTMDSKTNLAMDVATMGFFELFGTAFEANQKCQKKSVVLLFDKQENVAAICSDSEYKKLESRFGTLFNVSKINSKEIEQSKKELELIDPILSNMKLGIIYRDKADVEFLREDLYEEAEELSFISLDKQAEAFDIYNKVKTNIIIYRPDFNITLAKIHEEIAYTFELLGRTFASRFIEDNKEEFDYKNSKSWDLTNLTDAYCTKNAFNLAILHFEKAYEIYQDKSKKEQIRTMIVGITKRRDKFAGRPEKNDLESCPKLEYYAVALEGKLPKIKIKNDKNKNLVKSLKQLGDALDALQKKFKNHKK